MNMPEYEADKTFIGFVVFVNWKEYWRNYEMIWVQFDAQVVELWC